MIVLFLTGLLAMIMLRTLRKDLSRYNELDSREETADESGWKLVHGDIFRPPQRPALLSVYVGTGVQVIIFLVCRALDFPRLIMQHSRNYDLERKLDLPHTLLSPRECAMADLCLVFV